MFRNRKKYFIIVMLICSYLQTTLVYGSETKIIDVNNTKTSISDDDDKLEVVRHIEVENVTDIEEAESNINSIDGAIVLNSYEDDYYSSRDLLIPRETVDNEIEKIKSYGDLVYDNTSQNNITPRIRALETIIKNKENNKIVIKDMLKQTEDISTIVKFEKYLSDVEVEQSTAQLELDALLSSAEYTKVYVSYVKEEEVATNNNLKNSNFSSDLKNSFKNSFYNTILFFQNIVISLAYLIVPILIIGVGIIVVVLVKKGGKKNEKK